MLSFRGDDGQNQEVGWFYLSAAPWVNCTYGNGKKEQAFT